MPAIDGQSGAGGGVGAGYPLVDDAVVGRLTTVGVLPEKLNSDKDQCAVGGAAGLHRQHVDIARAVEGDARVSNLGIELGGGGIDGQGVERNGELTFAANQSVPPSRENPPSTMADGRGTGLKLEKSTPQTAKTFWES